MRTLYFDCFAGASGNMILAALLGLGVDKSDLEREIWKLKLPEISLNSKVVDRAGISALHVEVITPEQKKHRHLSDIVSIIEAAELDRPVKERAIAIFARLAEAEGKVHGISVDEVHFHEVGAIDAIVDIVAASAGNNQRFQDYMCPICTTENLFPKPNSSVAQWLLQCETQ